MATGIEIRHKKMCASHGGLKCNCKRSYRAIVFSPRDGLRRKTFNSQDEAVAWRDREKVAVRERTASPVVARRAMPTVDEAMAEWLPLARSGQIRTRGKRPFAPATIRAVEQNYRLRVKASFARWPLDELRLPRVQAWVDELAEEGLHPSTIETSVLPLRLVYRRAVSMGIVSVDPTDKLELPEKPAARSSRTPPPPARIAKLLGALEGEDRAIWATLIFTGLRRGELLALTWEQVRLDAQILRVEASFDPGSGPRPPKSQHGYRNVPVNATLAALLIEQQLRTGRSAGLVFSSGVREPRPLSVSALQTRADNAWADAGLSRLTPHVCRHLYASWNLEAGVTLEELSRYMGHSSIAVTYDRYAHLVTDREARAASKQDAFLAEIGASSIPSAIPPASVEPLNKARERRAS